MAKNKQQTLHSRHRAFYKHPVFYLCLIIILAVGVFLFIKNRPGEPKLTDTTTNTSSTKQSSPVSSTTTNSPSTTPTETSPSATDSSVSPDGKTPEKYEGADPNNSETLTGYITTARFDGDKLIIRVNIDQYLSGGTCTLTLTEGANQITKSAKLIPAASTSTCEGFDVPSTELTSFSRPIDINITITSNDRTGTIAGRVE